MDDSLGNALVIEVGDLFPEVKILQQGRPAITRLEGVVCIRQPQALRRRQI